jgi:DNA-binding MarR family transcriptional regulator
VPVKPPSDSPPAHLAYLLHRATQRLRAEGEAAHADSGPRLQAAQARLLDLIPAGGGRVTDLAGSMRISKQGLGQVAMQLAALGYVEITPDPSDKRAKMLTRTVAGERERLARRAVVDEIEDVWRAQVGAERYAVFRDVLAVVAGVDAAAGAG